MTRNSSDTLKDSYASILKKGNVIKMSNDGWIKLYRQILDSDIWISDEPFSKGQAWVDLLLLANHRDKEMIFDYKTVTVGRGQLITSVRKLSLRWGWGNQKTLKFLRLLEELKMVEKESDNRRTLLTIINYEVYQGSDNTDGTQIDTLPEHCQNTARTQITHKQEDKELKNEKNEKNNKPIRDVYFPNDELLNEAFGEYVLMRKKIKKPFVTDHAIELAIKKLEKLSGGDNDKAIQILNQSIMNNWQGLFELKTSGNKKPNSQQDWVDMWKNA